MINHERYRFGKSSGAIERYLSNVLWRNPSDRIIIPEIRAFKNSRVCDVGCGSGSYSRFFLENKNQVVGVDKNPSLMELDIRVADEDASDFARVFPGDVFDVVFSAWMTEYLSPEKLRAFFEQAHKVLKPNGTFITTVISDKGWGSFYVSMARSIRKIDKYNYGAEFVIDSLEKSGFIISRSAEINSFFKIPWAELYICVKK